MGDVTPQWVASWVVPSPSRPSLPQSLFCSGSSTCSFPLWKPTKSSIPVSKPIQTGFDQLLIFVQNNPHNQSLVLVIPKNLISSYHLHKCYQMTMFQQHKTQNKKIRLERVLKIRNRSFHYYSRSRQNF